MRRPTIFAAALTVTACLTTGCTDRKEEAASKLVIWQTETDENAKSVLVELEKSFEKSNPGIDVQIESIPWGKLSEKLITELRAGSPPDIAHVQPFMAYNLYEKNQLSAIDDVIADLEDDHGAILPAVRDLQLFDESHYGIAYAVGITGWTFDTRKVGGVALPYPADGTATITNDELFAYLLQVKAKNPNAKVLLPGGTPFFLDQLFGELVANAGGRLYDPEKRKFLFKSDAAREALNFFVRLKKEGLLSPNWKGQQYVEQFAQLASPNEVFLTPVTYARAAVAIDKTLNGEKAKDANGTVFRFMAPPTFAKGMRPVATIDAEPFVIFKHTEKAPTVRGGTKRQLAAKFLKQFYERERYLRFTASVPIHLTPIFETLANDPAYLKAIKPGWRVWHTHTMSYLKDPNLTRPILVPGPNASTLKQDLQNPYLLQLQAQGIISSAIGEALETDANVDDILDKAQNAAMRLVPSRS